MRPSPLTVILLQQVARPPAEQVHTAQSLAVEHFSIEIEGRQVKREALFAGQAHERFGIVVTSPLGALGASLLIELAVTAYYDVPGRERRAQPLYPEIYAFHVGGRFGNYGPMDFWPARKELFLAGDAAGVLEAINSHAITHLAVPAGPLQATTHRFKEPATALDRLERCFLYDPCGRVSDGEITIRALHPSLWADVDYVIDVHSGEERTAIPDNSTTDPIQQQSMREYLRRLLERRDEVTAVDRALAARHRVALRSGLTLAETFKSATVETALARLAAESIRNRE